jgi:hypothetical protein
MRYQKPIEYHDFYTMIFAPKFVSTHYRIIPIRINLSQISSDTKKAGLLRSPA